MTPLIEICIVAATLALVAIAVALVRLLLQARRTAAQAERTLAHFDAFLPALEQTVAEANATLRATASVLARVDRVAAGVEGTSGTLRGLVERSLGGWLAPLLKWVVLARDLVSGLNQLRGGRGAPPAAPGADPPEGR